MTWVNRAQRGDILASQGEILATSTISYDVGANQKLISQYVHTESERNEETGRREERVVGTGAVAAAAQLAPVLEMDPQELGAKLVGESTYVVIAEAVTPDTWRQIQALGIPGIEPDQRTRRNYPAGTVAGNILGYTYEGDNRELIGSAGIELTQNEVLTGTDGQGSVEIGRSGVIIPTGEQDDIPAIAGQTVRLTINSDLQAIAQQAIDEVVDAQSAAWGCAVVVEPNSGRVLVLADSDAVNPAHPGETAEENRNSRAVQAIFEPGSVGKVVTFAAALQEGAITPQSTFTVPDEWTAPNGQHFTDSHEHATQSMTAAQILAESSNTGTVQIGDLLSDDVRHRYWQQFGYGELTGIEMPAESEGILAEPSSWDDRTRYTTMFGQGIAGTALQAVEVLATVANKGIRVSPRIIESWTDAQGQERRQSQPEGVQVISSQAAALLTDMLVGVTQEGGTAEAASLDGYLVAGKTGTTEILTEPGTVASFVGFAPARNPAIAVAVIVYKPAGTYGGTVAAPVFRKIANAAMHAMGIAPDPTVVAAQAAAEADALLERQQ